MRPSITWYLFNLFRLAAVVFMVWALAAQFIALAGDLGQISNSTTPPATNLSNSTTSSTALSRPSTRSLSTIPVDPSTAVLITNSIPAPVRSQTPPSTPTAVQLGPDAITTTPPLIRPVTTARSTPVIDVNGPLTVIAEPIRRRRFLARRAEEVRPTSGVVGLSSVPTSTGGAMFASMSRMIMASALVSLLLAQLGLPEMWPYKHVPAFGPQSTPLWLGVGQVIIAVEGLRVYSVPLVWVAHAGLLVIGIINSHMGMALILLARRRKLPKSPAPPLYFSRTTRLLFFRPLPACYIQLLSKGEQEHIAAAQLDLSQSNLDDPDHDPEAGIGDGDRDLGPWKMRLKRNISRPIRRPSDGLNDIRQGGYPTFAKGGLGDTGTQIPASTIDLGPDGRMRGLIARPLGDRKSLETTGDAYSGYADADTDAASSRAPSRADVVKAGKGIMEDKKLGRSKSKRKPPPLGLSPVGSGPHPERRQFERQRSITAIKEKIHQRMERKAPIDDTIDEGVGAGVAGTRGLPTITTTAPSAGSRTGRRSTMIDSANTFGRPTILRSIPKRGNTISQTSVLPPTIRPSLPQRASSQTQVELAPVPIAKSPTKLMAESNLPSSLPWTKPINDSIESMPRMVKLPDKALHRTFPPQTSLVAPAESRSASGSQDKRDSQLSTDAGIYNAALVGTIVSGETNTSNLQPPATTVFRTPSGPKLQKVWKADTSSPLGLPKPANRSGTAPISNETSSLNRQASLGSDLGPTSDQNTSRKSPNTLIKKRASPSPIPLSPALPSSPLRPRSAQSISALQSSLRSSLAPLNRSGSVRSTRSTRTAMGVRFDLEKRYSTSTPSSEADDRESLLSPETNRSTSTPRSAGFRIPGTRFVVPFGTSTPKLRNRPLSENTSSTSSPYDIKDSDLILEMGDSEDDEDNEAMEAARPESFASQSTIGSMKENGSRLIEEEDVSNEVKRSIVGERAGLPKRAASIAVSPNPVRQVNPVLGGQYIDGGSEGNWKKGHARRPSSISIDSRY